MPTCAVIGGSGLTSLSGLEVVGQETVDTPFGESSAPILHGTLAGAEVIFLPRHGSGHTIPPHQINYRANLWSLSHLGVTHVLAVNAVGSILAGVEPGELLIPDQIIDYTWSRKHTFFEGKESPVIHIDFTRPYSNELREVLCRAAQISGVPVWKSGVYGATQGPRLETAAEIDRMEKDGCDVVGMTGMPEAALARELEIEYAAITVVVNHAAGRGPGVITRELIEANLAVGIKRVRGLLEEALPMVVPSR